MADPIIIKRTGQAPLRIRGERIAHAQSSTNNASDAYSGATGRCQGVSVYRTASGKFVVAIHHETQWQGERDTDEAGVFPSPSEVVGYLSGRVPNWLLQDVMEQLGEEEVAEEIY